MCGVQVAAGKPEGKNIEDVAVERSEILESCQVIKCEAVECVHVPGDS
jgi:hypothetical protein